MSEFVFAPAVREGTPMIVALAGASGSGKTYTALELAMGLAGGGKIAFIDTEGRRGLHYADQFQFDYCELRSPYTPRRFLAAWKSAEAAGYAVIVTDSYSDEYVGEGGLVDMKDAQLRAMKRPNDAAAWAFPKAEHKMGLRWMRQARCHLIFCLRAEEKVKLDRIGGETKVVPIGWMPICEKNVPFEMTTSFMLTPSHPGIVVAPGEVLGAGAIKLQAQHRAFFPYGKPITRECGRLLAEWCAGGATPSAGPPPARGARSEESVSPHPTSDRATLEAAGWEAAADGTEALEKWWKGLSRGERAALGRDLRDDLKAAAEADEDSKQEFWDSSDEQPDDPSVEAYPA